MGRQKGVPQKRKSGNDSNESFSEPFNCYNYRPVVKKRKSNRFGTHRFFTIDIPSATNKDYFIGTLSIGSTNNVMPDKYLSCKVSFRRSEEDDSDLLVLDCDDTYVLINCIIPNTVLKGKFRGYSGLDCDHGYLLRAFRSTEKRRNEYHSKEFFLFT